MTTDRADLKQIGLTVLNWTPCWSHLLSAIQVHIPTLQVLQRTIGSLLLLRPALTTETVQT